MTKVPSVPYFKIVAALQKITVPAHTPVLRSTLSHILKQARVEVEDFLTAL